GVWVEGVGGDGLVRGGVGLGRQCEQDDGGVVVGVLVAEEILARHHASRRREPDAGAGRIGSIGGDRGQAAECKREDGEEPQDHGDRHSTAIERWKIPPPRRRRSQRRDRRSERAALKWRDQPGRTAMWSHGSFFWKEPMARGVAPAEKILRFT